MRLSRQFQASHKNSKPTDETKTSEQKTTKATIFRAQILLR